MVAVLRRSLTPHTPPPPLATLPALMLIDPSPSTHPLRFLRPLIPPLQIVVLQDSFEPQVNKPATIINELNTPQYAYTNQEGDARAPWVEAFNVRPSGVCGTQDGNHALVFSGHVARRITTIDLDIRFGGTSNAAYVVVLCAAHQHVALLISFLVTIYTTLPKLRSLPPPTLLCLPRPTPRPPTRSRGVQDDLRRSR